MFVEHLIIAANSSIDFERNTMSVFDFIESVQIEMPQGMAKAPIPIHVIAIVKRESQDVGEIRTNFVLSTFGPGDVKQHRNDVPVNIAANVNRQRIRINAHFEVGATGIYKCRFEKGDNPNVSREISIDATVLPRIGHG